ncbi:hypothetical protein, partial [Erwinia amylovora]
FYKYHGLNNIIGRKYSWLTIEKYSSEEMLRQSFRDGLNLYAYAPNPLSWLYPLGLSKCKSDFYVGPA